MDIKVSLEKMPDVQTRAGVKPYRAHIVTPNSAHGAEADTPQEALVLAAMHWDRYSNK